MNARRGAAAVFGLLFGFMISWGHFTDPDEIREMLALEDFYLWKMFALAVVVAFAGTRLVRGRRALLVPERIDWATQRPGRRHIGGAVAFGLGWAVAASCPAPIAAQLAQGVWWSAFTFAGVAAGVLLYLRRSERGTPASGEDRSAGAGDDAAPRAVAAGEPPLAGSRA